MITDAWMQFDWTLALPMTLLIIYFLFILYRYYWRIYKRFRLPAEVAVTGAFNIGGQLGGAPPGVPTPEELQQEKYQAVSTHMSMPKPTTMSTCTTTWKPTSMSTSPSLLCPCPRLAGGRTR